MRDMALDWKWAQSDIVRRAELRNCAAQDGAARIASCWRALCFK